MDRSNIITLISETYGRNEYGVEVVTGTSRKDVYCQVNSITRAEFFDAGRNGLNPEFMFSMFAGNYSGEQTVEFNGNTYSVYRTYMGRSDTIELYVERKGGSNGKGN